MKILFTTFMTFMSFMLALQAQDWPQFRGPTGQGHSTEHGLPLEWDESHNVVWKVPVPGVAWSSPVVAAGRVWVTTGIESRGSISLRLLAFDATSGAQAIDVEVFRAGVVSVINPKNSHASPTPVVDGDRVYVHFGANGTAALTTDGKVLWKQRFQYESQHGSGGSPIIYGDFLIFSCDGADDASVIALDKKTGKTRWRTWRRQPYDQAYSTPLVIRVGDRDELVSVGAYRTAAYDPASGKEIWRVRYADGFSNVPRPIFAHGLVYITTGFQQPSLLAVRPDGTGDVTKTHVAWTLTRGAPLTPSPIVVGDELYVLSDPGILTCVDAKSGAVLWQQRLGGDYSASPVAADGRIYFLAEQGVTTVIAAGKEFRRLAVNRLDGSTLASMAVANGALFIRSDHHLYRIGGSSRGLIPESASMHVARMDP
jgi:outer membrane protein assembly factor BamB